MILVTGASGKIGRHLVAELTSAEAPVRALTRNEENARSLQSDGVDVAIGDFAEPSELDQALDGVDRVFLLSSQHPDLAALEGNVVNAAKKADAKRIVKLSAGGPLTLEDSPSFVGRQHWQSEQQIKESGVGYTFLRPNYFMQNLLMFAEPIRGGTLPLPFADRRVAMVDTRDIAAVAVRALTEDGRHDGKIYEVTGPEALTGAEVAQRFGRVLDRDMQHVSPPVDAVVERFRAQGAPDWMQQHFRELIGLFLDGAGEGATDTVEEVLGRPPRRVDDFARDHAAAFS